MKKVLHKADIRSMADTSGIIGNFVGVAAGVG
jgi:hypothetical protein